MLDFFRRTGAASMSVVAEAGRMFIFLWTAIYWTFVPPLKFGRVIRQISFIGAKSTPLIVFTGSFTGMILGIQMYYTLRKFGADAYLGPSVALILIKELGPVLSALMITARAGSAITAEIGIMRITEQVDALETMSLSPFRYLMVPNLLAALVSFPLLASIYNVVGIFSGYMVGVKMLGISSGTYNSMIQQMVVWADIREGIVKSVCFGLIVLWVSCYKGYYTKHGAEGVSKATTGAVVMSATLILVWDYFLDAVMLNS